MPYAQLETYEPKIVPKSRLKTKVNLQAQPERPGWIPAHITENWDTDPFAYQTEEELMPAGGLHGQLLTYITEVLRVSLKKQGLMLLVDTFLLYRDSNNIKKRIAPDLLLMEDCFPAPSAYDLDTRTSPSCLIETTSPKSHLKDLQENVPFYFSLGVKTYLVIDAITPQQTLRNPIELHLWRKTKGQSYQKIEADSTGYFWLPEMNIKISAKQQRLTFINAATGEVLRDTEQFEQALEESEQRANTAERHAETAFEDGKQKGRFVGMQEKTLEIAQNMLVAGIDMDLVAKTTGLSHEKLRTLTTLRPTHHYDG